MFKVGFAQFCPQRYDVEKNIDTLRNLLSGIKTDLLVLPELSNSGYLYADRAALAPHSEDCSGSGPFLSALSALAKDIGGVIVAGFAEKGKDGLYNSAAALNGRGVIQVYRKTHLFADEPDLFLPGDSGFRVFDHKGIRIGMMVCFDWIFPEAARSLALKGAQIIAHPANLVLPFCQQAMITRSLENAVFSITTNRYGLEQVEQKSLHFTGSSQVVDPKGNRLLQAPPEGDCVRICEIDPATADAKQITARNHLFANRRPEMYSLE
jgi:predicted amidohydrolase